MEARCQECGSWEAECSADAPVPGCGCSRCARAELQVVRAALQALWDDLERRGRRAADTHERLRNHPDELERRHASNALVEMHFLGNVASTTGHLVLKALAATRPTT